MMQRCAWLSSAATPSSASSGIVHIGALARRQAGGHEIQPAETQHVIKTDRAGVARRRLDHRAKWCEVARGKTRAVEARKSPVLSRRVEDIGRRTDRKLARDRILLQPRVETVGANADCDVEIEPDLHPLGPGEIGAGLELRMGDPLHVLHELDVVAARAHAKFVDVAIGRLATLVRPFPPWPLELFSQRLEAGKARQQRTALLPECLELPPSLAQAIRLETRERKLQHRPASSLPRPL